MASYGPFAGHIPSGPSGQSFVSPFLMSSNENKNTNQDQVQNVLKEILPVFEKYDPSLVDTNNNANIDNQNNNRDKPIVVSQKYVNAPEQTARQPTTIVQTSVPSTGAVRATTTTVNVPAGSVQTGNVARAGAGVNEQQPERSF